MTPAGLGPWLNSPQGRSARPQAIWPGQIADALRGLIHAANQARDQGLTAVPDNIAAPLIHAFRHGVLAGLSEISRRPPQTHLQRLQRAAGTGHNT